MVNIPFGSMGKKQQQKKGLLVVPSLFSPIGALEHVRLISAAAQLQKALKDELGGVSFWWEPHKEKAETILDQMPLDPRLPLLQGRVLRPNRQGHLLMAPANPRLRCGGQRV